MTIYTGNFLPQQDRTPYTYLLTHLPTNTHYYGVRYAKGCHPDDFWTTYFTSSDHIARLISEYGVDSFVHQIRKIFTNSIPARKWETTVLRRIRAVTREDFINRTDSDIRFFHDPEFKWWNNGVENTLSVTCPGSIWCLGRLKQKPTTLGKRTYNNGVIQKSFKDHPGPGWVHGMLPKQKVVYEEVTCPNCGRVGKGSGMQRYHFNKCSGKSSKKNVVPGGQGNYVRLRACCVKCKMESSVNNIKRYHERCNYENE